MSSEGTPILHTPVVAGLSVAVISTCWHREIIDGLRAGALRALAEAEAVVTEISVPGSFELPVAARAAAARHQAVVALGVIIEGGTPHFEYVANAATLGLQQVAVDTGVPVAFGVLTCANYQQAYDRAGFADSTSDKGYEAAQAAVLTYRAIVG